MEKSQFENYLVADEKFRSDYKTKCGLLCLVTSKRIVIERESTRSEGTELVSIPFKKVNAFSLHKKNCTFYFGNAMMLAEFESVKEAEDFYTVVSNRVLTESEFS